MPAAVAAYAQLAQQIGLSPAQLALGFLRSRAYVASTIVGATSMAQLKENLGGTVLSAEQLHEIEPVHLRFSNPAPESASRGLLANLSIQ